MRLNVQAVLDTPEEKEHLKRSAVKKRVLTLTAIAVVAIIARILIKDPPPPKAPAHHEKVRYLPGVIDNLTPAQKAKIDPLVLAELEAASSEFNEKKQREQYEAFAQKRAVEEWNKKLEDLKKIQKQLVVKYKVREYHSPTVAEKKELQKTILVRFKGGGYIKAQKAYAKKGNVNLEMDASMAAQFPQKMVSQITPDALNWQEPVPQGQVKLKPGHGMTIIVAKSIAGRITAKPEL
ncbi:MAG: hypothetical protein LHV69_05595 [Elusimicrobia bacterium]|nr:hypothetical protein [Candidatus Obscuribacterium magneticum]